MSDFVITTENAADLPQQFIQENEIGILSLYYTIDGGRDLQFPLTVGAGVTSSFHFGNPFFVNLAVIFPLGIEYNFEQLNPDVPITMYVRLAPGFTLFNGGEFSVKFAFAGYIGALWMF